MTAPRSSSTGGEPVARTPTPWTSRLYDGSYRVSIFGADGVEVAATSWHSSIRATYPLKPESLANIAFIVRAVNSHEAREKALQLIADIAEGSGTANSLPNIAKIARAALAGAAHV